MVSTSLASGSRRLAAVKVLVKRLVCIEDLGDMDVLVTDKTGTLTEGRIRFIAALDPAGARTARRRCASACWAPRTIPPTPGPRRSAAMPWTPRCGRGRPAPAAPVAACRSGLLPFDHERLMILGAPAPPTVSGC